MEKKILSANANTFKNNLELILKYTKEELIERETWGTANFRNYENEFTDIFFFVNEFSRLDISFIPDTVFPVINDTISHIINVFNQIDKYDVSTQKKADIDTRCDTLKTHVDNLKTHLGPWLPVLAYKRGDIDAKISELDIIMLDAADRANGIKQFQSRFEKESSEILQAMRDTSASAGVGVFNQDFENAAKNNKTDATYWGRWLGFLSLVTIIFPIIAFFLTPENINLGVLISSKILVMAVLITASLWVGRMYKSAKHQEAINIFKANALRTFQAFIKATEDEQTKNAVLLETTKAIFTAFNPGYISMEQSANDSLKIMEVFKNLPQKE